MRNLFIPLFFFFGIISAQDLEGSWRLTHVDDKEVTDKEVVKIYQDGYFAYGAKEAETDKFLKAAGGEFSVNQNSYTEIQDFNTEDTSAIGKEKKHTFSAQGDQLKISSDDTSSTWERISDAEDDLAGTWVITGRKRGDEMQTMTPGDRRTVKILSGHRFQWIAFNSKTKEFSGTGGGTYTAENGTYIENIEFFSRDDSRVGASLEFEYEVKDGKWHHQGTSSKGDPIYEIWSPYEEAYQKEQ